MNRLERILYQSRKNEWGKIIPPTPHRLSLGVDSLYRSAGKFWRMDAAELESVLEKNPLISAQFNAHDELAIAYVIWRKRHLVKDENIQPPG
jgi:hypothetical protein